MADIPTVAKFATVQKEGEREVKREVEYYNLDMILSVGYRVKSDKGILFRKWANNVLKDYMLKGYAVNQKRLEYLEKTVKLIDIANRMDERLEGNDAKEILRVIGDYSKALNLLDDYDHRTLEKVKGNIDERKIKYDDCIHVINQLRFNSESSIFAIERNRGLEAIIGNIYQSFGGQDIYKSIEEKGANFLYLIVKNHVFVDGNKRIAATLFIYFLNFYGILYKNGRQTIDNNTLAALTLLIAESNPKEKEIIMQQPLNLYIKNNNKRINTASTVIQSSPIRINKNELFLTSTLTIFVLFPTVTSTVVEPLLIPVITPLLSTVAISEF